MKGSGMNPLKSIASALLIGAITASAPFDIARAHQPVDIAGKASWYGPGFHGRKTASGERFDQNELTAAHPTLPFDTKVRVTNEHNGRSVVVRINDRGPYAERRVIDLSKGAAKAVGMLKSGVAPVSIEVLGTT